MKSLLLISLLVFSSPLLAYSPAAPRYLTAPQQENVYLVVKGVFDTKAEAEETRKFIQQLLVRTPADGLIASENLQGFPVGKWVIASVFDEEAKAKWWMHFSDRNKKLPRPYIKKTQVLRKAEALPYFPEAMRGGERRFASEREILSQIDELPDVRELKKGGELKVQFTKYPRTEDLRYEVEILKKKGNNFISYDFVKVDAQRPESFTRFSDKLK